MSRFQVGDKVWIKPGTTGIPGEYGFGVLYSVINTNTTTRCTIGHTASASYGAAFMDSELLPYDPDHVTFKPEADTLAMIEAVRKWRHDWFNEPVEGVRRKAHLKRLDSILDGTPWPD